MSFIAQEDTGPRRTRRAVWVGLVVSALLHLSVLYLGRDLGQETKSVQVFRARLAAIPRFQPRRLAGVTRPTLPSTRMTYVPGKRGEPSVAELPLERLQRAPSVVAPRQPLALRERHPGGKEEQPVLEREVMVPPTQMGLADSLGIPSMDLLRIVDLARANRQHAMVIRDPSSRRDLLGYVNISRIELYGAGNRGIALDALARYARDHSRLLVRVQAGKADYFRSAELLKDPIVFLFEGAGVPRYDDRTITHFSDEEIALLGKYLRGGGFLYLEGSNRFLREMVTHMHAALGAEGEVFPLGARHPLYHAFFSFDDGFPGEEGKRRTPVSRMGWGWDYPAMAPDSSAAQAPVDPRLAQSNQDRALPLGLWGVRWHGQTVALLSDIGLSSLWARSYDRTEGRVSAEPALSAGLNILVYALTRKGTLTPQVAPPQWMTLRPQIPVAQTAEEDSAALPADEGLVSELDAALAVVRVPLGTTLEGKRLQIRLDGVYTVEFPAVTADGVMIHNMPAGSHWLTLRFSGITRQVEVELTGGRVSTVTFGIDRFAFLRRLHVTAQKRRVALGQWRKSFSDLTMEDIFLAEDRDLLERSSSQATGRR